MLPRPVPLTGMHQKGREREPCAPQGSANRGTSWSVGPHASQLQTTLTLQNGRQWVLQHETKDLDGPGLFVMIQDYN